MANISLKVLIFLVIIYSQETEISFGPTTVKSIAFKQGMRTVKRYAEAHLNFLEFP